MGGTHCNVVSHSDDGLQAKVTAASERVPSSRAIAVGDEPGCYKASL